MISLSWESGMCRGSTLRNCVMMFEEFEAPNASLKSRISRLRNVMESLSFLIIEYIYIISMFIYINIYIYLYLLIYASYKINMPTRIIAVPGPFMLVSADGRVVQPSTRVSEIAEGNHEVILTAAQRHGKRLVTMNECLQWPVWWSQSWTRSGDGMPNTETAMVDRHFRPFSTQTSLNHHLATVMSVTKVIAHPVQEPKGKMNSLSAGALAGTCRLSSCYAILFMPAKCQALENPRRNFLNYIRPPFLTFLHLTRQ